MKTATAVVLALLAAGCALEESSYKKSGYGDSSLAITNAEGEAEVLRTGTSLNVASTSKLTLKANTIYRVYVTNVNTSSEIARADLLSDPLGAIELSAIAHDIGEFDDVQERHSLSVRVEGADKKSIVELTVPVTPHEVHFEGHGFQVDEVQPPHLFSCDKTGTALNSYVVGALPDPGESAPPIYVAGKGFPSGITQVDLYVVKDRDRWQGKKIPRPGDEEYVHGPVVGRVERGILLATALDWQPSGKQIGPYDILADVDRNGTFDYSFSAKDGADGEAKVGLTLQYGAAWFRAKSAATASKLSVDAAKAAYDAANASATQAEQAAQNGGPQAQQLAQQARAKANDAQAEYQKASAASSAAQSAFDQTLADDKTATAQAALADAAAKAAAAAADAAGKLVNDAKAAAAAYKAAVAAAMASKHLLVNLAYNSSSLSGGRWANSYAQSSKIYSFVNPPVQQGERHAFVTKYVVYHQSWSSFWNHPDNLAKGKIYFGDKIVQMTGGTVQKSCTNAPPVAVINPAVLPVDAVPLKFDIVYDYNGDGYYEVGKDLLDVVGHTENAALMSAKDLVGIPDDQIFGFQVTKK
jgi:hypothetical protein